MNYGSCLHGIEFVISQETFSLNVGVFIARGKEDALVTKNMVAGESVYGEKKISVDAEGGEKVEYRVWNPFRSKLAAAILGGIDKIHMKPGSKVLYLGAASGTTVSHVSDIVGPVSNTFDLRYVVFIGDMNRLSCGLRWALNTCICKHIHGPRHL